MSTGNYLTTSSQIQCTHGGMATLFTTNVTLFAGGAPVLLESDVLPVVGCPFTVGTKYSPCVRIEWTAGSRSTSVDGTPVLVQASVGKCIGAEGAPQGVAIVSPNQMGVVAG